MKLKPPFSRDVAARNFLIGIFCAVIMFGGGSLFQWRGVAIVGAFLWGIGMSSLVSAILIGSESTRSKPPQKSD